MEPIRILHVVPNMQAGGLETFIMNVYRNIDREKVQFDFLVHYRERKFYDEEIAQLGGVIYRFSLREDGNLLKYLYELNKFFRLHREYKIIHCHMESIGFLVFLFAKFYKIEVRISHAHTNSTEKNLKGRVKFFLSKLVKYVSTDNYACSVEAGDYLFGKRPYKVLENGIELDRFWFKDEKRKKVREELGISEETMALGHIGRFCLAKNHWLVVDIFYEYQKKVANSVLLLVGEGEELARVRKKCQDLKIEDKVKFLGVRKDTDYLYSAFDVFLLPSLFEGLGIVLIEAQMAGLYCYASKEVVPTEALISDRLQYIDLEKPASWWALKIITDNKYDRRKIAFTFQKEKYDIKKVVKTLEDFYIKKFN